MDRSPFNSLAMIFVSLVSLMIATLSTGCAPRKGPQAEIIPREVIFGNPEKAGPQLSPDGSRLAYAAPVEGVMNVWVKTVGADDDKPVTNDRNRGVQIYFWAPNGEQILYIQDRNGDENWHIYAIPAGGGEPRDLTPIKGIRAMIYAVDPDFLDEILVGLNNRIPQLHDVYRLNLETGKLTLEVRNDLGALGFIADHTFTVRIALVPSPDGGFIQMHRKTADAPWEELRRWGYEDAMSTGSFGFAKDNHTLYTISSVGSNTAQLRTYDVFTGEEKVVAADPTSDVSGLMMKPRTYELQAVRFARDRAEWQALDEEVKPHLEALGTLHRGDFGIVDRTQDDDAWLVVYDVDNGPVTYFAYDPATMKGVKLFSTRPALEQLPLAEMKPVMITARDGLELHCYLTTPVGMEPKGLPAVVKVHGGPWYRDSWGYDPEAQWLANRGYAVLAVNFRGSTGFGKEFVNAANREWGAKMQDDVTDATRWLIQQGIADPRRIGIYGGSYGGFATLAGVTREPDLYTCGIDAFGPANLITWLKTIPPYWEPLKPLFYRRIGNPEVDTVMLKERSPINHIDRIKVPLLVVQGANDPRVPKSEALQVRDALNAAGKEVSYMEFPDEGHGFAKPENRLKFYGAAEQFLADHLGGRYEK